MVMSRRSFIRGGVSAAVLGALGWGIVNEIKKSIDKCSEYYILEREDGTYLKIKDIDAFYKLRDSPKQVQDYLIKTGLRGYTATSFSDVQGSQNIHSKTLVDILVDYNTREGKVTTKEGRMNLQPTDKPIVAVERYRKDDQMYISLKNEFNENPTVIKYLIK